MQGCFSHIYNCLIHFIRVDLYNEPWLIVVKGPEAEGEGLESHSHAAEGE